MGEDSGEKTEEPTPHKLREARKKGQIAKSKEFTSAVLLIVSFFTFKMTAISMWEQLGTFSNLVFGRLATDLSPAIMGGLLFEGLRVILLTLAPLLSVIVVITILMEALQTQFLISSEPLMPKLSNINPIEGVKKFFQMKQYVELIKSVIKMACVIGLLYIIFKQEFYIIPQSQSMNIWVVMQRVGQMVFKVVTWLGILYIVLALFDYFYQRYEYIKSMRMTKKEIKEEYKRLEGDPTIKQRQRQAQRDMAQGRQMGAVPGADVVVTNPVHFAVAIKYDHKSAQKAPVVVAKGRDLVAFEIKRIAEESRVLVVENPPLAQSLFRHVDVGSMIPPVHYRVMAEILAFVFHVKRKREAQRYQSNA